MKKLFSYIFLLLLVRGSPAFAQESDKKSQAKEEKNIEYKELFIQSSVFLGLKHATRIATQDYTRAELRGPFVRDWFKSIHNTHGWRDGDIWAVNYISHPLMGSTSAFIFANNDKVSKNAKFGFNKEYFRAKKRQFIFSVIYSENFEFGPLSEASIGNVGIGPHRKKNGYVDHVITPAAGILLSVAEDAIDAKLLRPVMRDHKIIGGVMAFFLNPTRSAANILSCKWPGHRD